VKCLSKLQPLGGWSVTAEIIEVVEDAGVDQEVSTRGLADLGIEGVACVSVDYGR
jgi:hypothetical protein